MASGSKWRIAALAALLGAALGAGAVFLTVPAPVPSWAGAATEVDASLTVVPQQYLGQQLVAVTAQRGAEQEILWPTSGVVREVNCAVGEQIESGNSLFTIDNDPILALHTATPLWRDLTPGLQGDDVRALQEELNRLGASVAVTGTFGPATTAAVRSLWAGMGGDGRQTSIPLAQVMWLYDTQVLVSDCPVQVGQHVDAATRALTVGGQLESLTLTTPTTPAGHRALIAGSDVAAELPTHGVMTDADFLAAFSQTPAFIQYVTDGGSLTVTTVLDQPIDVVAVPASALFDVFGPQGCLMSDGQAVEVEIVASQFGQTLVRADPLPRTVLVNPPAASPSCRDLP